MKKRGFLYSLCAAAMAMSGLVLGAAPASATITNTPGYFHLENVGSGKCIDATYPNNDPSAGYAQQWRCLNTAFEEWKYVPLAWHNRTAPVFEIVNGYTGQCLTQDPSSFGNGSRVVLRPCDVDGFSGLQAWQFGCNGESSHGPVFQLQNQWSLRVLDLENGDTSDGVPMQVWDCNPNTSNQRWTTIDNSDGGGGGGGCATSTPSSAHPAAIRPHRITCP